MVSLIIVDYKTIPKTLQYIKECYRAMTDAIDMHTIIVDNCEDTSIGLSQLEQAGVSDCHQIGTIQYSNIVSVYRGIFAERELLYVSAMCNLGYAGGNNLGSYVSERYYQDPYYLFSNNDLRFPLALSLQQLIEPMQRDEHIAAVGPHIVDLQGVAQSPRKKSSAWIQLFVNYYDMLLPRGMKITDAITDVVDSKESAICDWVLGAFFIVDAVKFRQAGRFDSNTFLYCEEIILAHRLLQYGFHMYYEHSVLVVHEHGQTVKTAFTAMKSIHISFQSSLYYYQNYRKINKATIVLAHINYGIFSLIFGIKKIGKRLFAAQIDQQ